MFLRFMRLLSQLYQGVPPADEPPYYRVPPPYPFKAEDWGQIPMPDLELTFSVHEVPPFLIPGLVKPERIILHFSSEQVVQIQRLVQSLAPPEDKDLRLSKQDALFALLVYCMSQADAECFAGRISVIMMVSASL